MKKVLLAVCIAVVALTGCGANKGEDVLGNKFTVKEYIEGSNIRPDLYILVDKKTGVNYYYVNAGHGKSLCPVYNKEGKVVVDKIEQE